MAVNYTSIFKKPYQSLIQTTQANQPRWNIPATQDQASAGLPTRYLTAQPNAQLKAQPKAQPNTQPYIQPNAQPNAQLNDIYSNRMAALRNTYDQGQTISNQGYDLANKQLRSQIPVLQGQINTAQNRGNQLLKNLQSQADLSRQTLETTTGQDLQALARSKQQTDAQRLNQFAALNTVESGGSMGYGGQQTNADTEFLNRQAGILQNKETGLKQLELDLSNKRMDTQNQVDQAIAAFENTLQTIDSTIAQNTQANAQAKNEAYAKLQENLYGIGKDYQDYQVATSNAGGSTNTAQSQQMKSQAVDNIDLLLKGDAYKALSGRLSGLKTSSFINPQGFAAKNIADQLVAILSLQNANLLKGSGAVSDAERQLLQNASIALKGGLPESETRRILEETRNQLQGWNNAGASNSNQYSGLANFLLQNGVSPEELAAYGGY